MSLTKQGLQVIYMIMKKAQRRKDIHVHVHVAWCNSGMMFILNIF